MKLIRLVAGIALALSAAASSAADVFPLSDVRLTGGPFKHAQDTNLNYLMALDADRLIAPFLRECGLPQKKPSYGNWESSGLDGHMGGHYLSALALMYASTGDKQVLARLNRTITELKKCQAANGNGYLGGIPGGKEALDQIRKGDIKADNFSVNGKWVPWYNLHKTYAGLRDAWRYAGNKDAKAMLIQFSDWAVGLSKALKPEQMQAMLKSEHGGMNEVLADVYQMTGQRKYLDAARAFSHQAILQPLEHKQDKLTGLHANTQIPKVIGFERIGELTGETSWHKAAEYFWDNVHDKRSVAIGGNSVGEHFHKTDDFSPMVKEIEGPETCNTYNMLRLTQALFKRDPKGRYGDYLERALYNHILSSQHPDHGGFVYFTPMRPNHFRVYSDVHKAMWCCVGSGIESQSKYGEFVYAHDKDSLYVNLYAAATVNWRAKGITVAQATLFPDEDSSRLTIQGKGQFTLKLRYPGWVKAGAMQVSVNGKPVEVNAAPGGYVSIQRAWKPGDRVDVRLPMQTTLEQMPDQSNYYAVLRGPIVLAAKTRLFADEKLNFVADDSRMGHIAKGAVCPLESAPLFVSDRKDFVEQFKAVPGQPMTFTVPAGLVQGAGQGEVRLIPFFRLHDSRYTVYWPHSTPSALAELRSRAAGSEAERLALDARTIDQVAPGQQQPESDHVFKGEGADAGLNGERHWRHATGWFSYVLNDPKREAKVLRLTFSRGDAGRRFSILANGRKLADVTLRSDAADAFYTVDYPIPEAAEKLEIRFVAAPGSIAGGLYGLRLLK